MMRGEFASVRSHWQVLALDSVDLRSEFRKRLLRFEEVSFAFFFGSRPGGKARVDSA